MSYRNSVIAMMAVVLAAWVSVTSASVKVREIQFTQGDKPIQGILAWDDAIKARRPGVLVVHGGFGYSWGGGVVLDMARKGADLGAVVAFHGVLDTRTPAQKGSVKARVLVLSGDEDTFAKPDTVEALRREMQSAGANFKIVLYPGVK